MAVEDPHIPMHAAEFVSVAMHWFAVELRGLGVDVGAEDPTMVAADDWVLSFASPSGDLLLVAWSSASFEHVLRLPGVRGCWQVNDWSGRPREPICAARSGHAPQGSAANETHISVTSAPLYLRQAA